MEKKCKNISVYSTASLVQTQLAFSLTLSSFFPYTQQQQLWNHVRRKKGPKHNMKKIGCTKNLPFLFPFLPPLFSSLLLYVVRLDKCSSVSDYLRSFFSCATTLALLFLPFQAERKQLFGESGPVERRRRRSNFRAFMADELFYIVVNDNAAGKRGERESKANQNQHRMDMIQVQHDIARKSA